MSEKKSMKGNRDSNIVNNSSIRIEHIQSFPRECIKIIELTYSTEDIQKIKRNIENSQFNLIAKLDDKIIGIVALREELKERLYFYIKALTVLPGKTGLLQS